MRGFGLGACGVVALAWPAHGDALRTDPASIRAAAERHVVASAPAPAGLRVHATAGRLDARLALAPCAMDLTPFLPPGGRLRARTLVGVRCAGPQPWTLWVPVDVETEGPVLIARRVLARGASPAAADVETVVRRVPGPPAQYLSAVADLEGRRLRRAVPAGQPLPVDALEDAPRVARGQQVTVVAATPGVGVRVAGVALASAAAGRRVQVRNVASGRVLEGTVAADGTVIVDP